jgi:3-oxoadipate enol-lactonase
MPFIEVNGTVLHYRIAGPKGAPALAFVNALGTDTRIWDETLAALRNKVQVLVYDMRGHGLSGTPPPPYSIDDEISDLLELTDYVGLRSFGLIGLSMGGLVGQAFAARHPNRIDVLALCATAARIGTTQLWRDRIAAVAQGGLEGIGDTVIERWFSSRFRHERAADVSGWRNMLARMDPVGYAASCAVLRDTDLGAEIDRISAPTLVIAGAGDIATPPAISRETAARISHSRVELIAGVGHLIPLEAPAMLSRLISNFLEEVGYA